jgi:hypothetical protein
MKIDVFLHVTTCSLVDRYQHFGGAWCLTLQGWRVCQASRSYGYVTTDGQSAILSGCQAPHMGPKTRFLLLSDNCGFVHVGRPLRREDGSVVYNCCWASPAQSFSGWSSTGLMTIIYCLRLKTVPTWRARSPYLYPPVTGWPSYTPRHWVPFSSPPTTRRATVEVFEPASTRGIFIVGEAWRNSSDLWGQGIGVGALGEPMGVTMNVCRMLAIWRVVLNVQTEGRKNTFEWPDPLAPVLALPTSVALFLFMSCLQVYPENGGSIFLRNVGTLLWHYWASALFVLYIYLRIIFFFSNIWSLKPWEWKLNSVEMVTNFDGLSDLWRCFEIFQPLKHICDYM